MKKVLNLVLGCKIGRYLEIDIAAKETWATKIPENIRQLFLIWQIKKQFKF